MRRFRPSKRVILGAAGGAVAAVSAALFMNGATNIAIPGVSDLAALMQERSPGAREKGVLSKKAPLMAAAAPKAVPQSQVLPVAAAPPAAVPAPAAVVPPPVPISALPAAAAVPVAAVPAGGAGFVPALLPLVVGGDDSTTIVTQQTPPGVDTPPTPAPPIPEPGTWLMLISGFGLLGLALRRRRRLSALKGTGGERGAAYPAGPVRQN